MLIHTRAIALNFPDLLMLEGKYQVRHETPALIQLAKALGAFVIATVSSESKSDYVRRVGADAVIVSAGGDLKRASREGVLAATNGREANIVCNTVGGEALTAGLRALGFSGRMIVIGFAGAQIPEVRVNYLLLRNLAVLGAPLDMHFDLRPELMAQGIGLMREIYCAGTLRPTIKSVLPFDRFHAALTEAADATTPGRVVINIS